MDPAKREALDGVLNHMERLQGRGSVFRFGWVSKKIAVFQELMDFLQGLLLRCGSDFGCGLGTAATLVRIAQSLQLPSPAL